MSSPSPSSLEEAIRDAGESWIIDWFSPPSEALNHSLFLRFRGLNPEFVATLFTESTYMR